MLRSIPRSIPSTSSSGQLRLEAMQDLSEEQVPGSKEDAGAAALRRLGTVSMGSSLHSALGSHQRGLEAGDVRACSRWDFTPAPLPLDRECDV